MSLHQKAGVAYSIGIQLKEILTISYALREKNEMKFLTFELISSRPASTSQILHYIPHIIHIQLFLFHNGLRISIQPSLHPTQQKDEKE